MVLQRLSTLCDLSYFRGWLSNKTQENRVSSAALASLTACGNRLNSFYRKNRYTSISAAFFSIGLAVFLSKKSTKIRSFLSFIVIASGAALVARKILWRGTQGDEEICKKREAFLRSTEQASPVPPSLIVENVQHPSSPASSARERQPIQPAPVLPGLEPYRVLTLEDYNRVKRLDRAVFQVKELCLLFAPRFRAGDVDQTNEFNAIFVDRGNDKMNVLKFINIYKSSLSKYYSHYNMCFEAASNFNFRALARDTHPLYSMTHEYKGYLATMYFLLQYATDVSTSFQNSDEIVVLFSIIQQLRSCAIRLECDKFNDAFGWDFVGELDVMPSRCQSIGMYFTCIASYRSDQTFTETRGEKKSSAHTMCCVLRYSFEEKLYYVDVCNGGALHFGKANKKEGETVVTFKTDARQNVVSCLNQCFEARKTRFDDHNKAKEALTQAFGQLERCETSYLHRKFQTVGNCSIFGILEALWYTISHRCKYDELHQDIMGRFLDNEGKGR